MIVFVTGATGFIGKVFLQRLLVALQTEDRVRVLTRSGGTWTDPRIVVVSGDLAREGDWLDALAGVDWVFHLAAEASLGKGAHYQKINAEPVAWMIRRLKGSAALKRFVFVSTVGAVDRSPGDQIDHPLNLDSVPCPTSDYGRSKLAAEKMVQESGLPFTIIRPTWVYGSGMRVKSHLNVMAQLIARRPWAAMIAFPGRVPLIHVNDLSDAIVRCLHEPRTAGQTYFAVTENRSLGEVFSALHLAIFGSRRPRVHIPSFGPIIRRIHRWLPQTVTQLFIDYLAVEDPAFQQTLLSPNAILLEQGVSDVAARYRMDRGWWLVTGANGGIGRALVNALRQDGCRVIAVDRNTRDLAPSADLQVIQADLTDRMAIEELAGAIGGLCLAGLINNAGIGFRGGLFEQGWDKAELTIRVNILGTLQLTHLLKDQILRDGTTIVNIASSVAYHPLPDMSVYAATKSFILNWSLSLSEELRGTNRVVTFSPSGTRTDFQKSSGVKGANGADLLDPAFVAKEILHAARHGARNRLLGWKSHLMVRGAYFLPVTPRLRVLRMLFAAAR